MLGVVVSRGVCQYRIVRCENGVPYDVTDPHYEIFDGADVVGAIKRIVKAVESGALDPVSKAPDGVVIATVPATVAIGAGWPAMATKGGADGKHSEVDEGMLWSAVAKSPSTALTGVSDVRIPDGFSYAAIPCKGIMRTFVAQYPTAFVKGMVEAYSADKTLPPLARVQVLPASIVRYLREHHTEQLATHSVLVYGAGSSFMLVTGSESGGGEWLLANQESLGMAPKGKKPGDALCHFVEATFESVSFPHNKSLFVVRMGSTRENFDEQLQACLPGETKLIFAQKALEFLAVFHD